MEQMMAPSLILKLARFTGTMARGNGCDRLDPKGGLVAHELVYVLSAEYDNHNKNMELQVQPPDAPQKYSIQRQPPNRGSSSFTRLPIQDSKVIRSHIHRLR